MIDRRTMDEDFYKILGVSRDASDKEIQKAYRALARKHHPDRVDEDQRDAAKKRFQKIQEAYDVLSDPEKRKMYDQFGPDFRQAGAAGADPFQGFRSGAGGHSTQFDFSDLFGGGGGGFEDFVAQMQGGRKPAGGRGRRAPRQGESLEAETTISFATSITGGSVDLSLSRGNSNERISVTIPAGIEDGKKIRLKGQGQPSPSGGPAGDLLLTIRVAAHPHYKRVGDNLQLTMPVTLEEATLGARIDVPTPAGTISLKVPAGSSSGRKLRLKGQGVKRAEGSGDLIVELQVALPDKIDERSKELILELQSRFAQENVRQGIRWQ